MNILKKTQNALANWLKDQDLGDIPSSQVYTGIDNEIDDADNADREQREMPCVICQCDQADVPDGQYGTGNYTCRGRIIIMGLADDMSDDEFEEMAETVVNFIETDSIAGDLSGALDDYTAQTVRIKAQAYSIVERHWEHVLELEIDCCGSDIT